MHRLRSALVHDLPLLRTSEHKAAKHIICGKKGRTRDRLAFIPSGTWQLDFVPDNLGALRQPIPMGSDISVASVCFAQFVILKQTFQ